MQPVPPCPAHARWWRTGASGLVLCWELWLGAYSAGFFFLPLLVMLPSEIPKLPTDPPERVSCCLETFSSFMTPFPGWLSIPNSSNSLFVFYILSYLLLKRMGCLSGCLASSASVQKLFCGSCSAFKWSFDESVGEKVVSPSYSSAILGPSPRSFNFRRNPISPFFVHLSFGSLILKQWPATRSQKFACMFLPRLQNF